MVRRKTRCLSAFLFAVLGLACFAALPACNTVEGAGEDLEDASDATRDAMD